MYSISSLNMVSASFFPHHNTLCIHPSRRGHWVRANAQSARAGVSDCLTVTDWISVGCCSFVCQCSPSQNRLSTNILCQHNDFQNGLLSGNLIVWQCSPVESTRNNVPLTDIHCTDFLQNTVAHPCMCVEKVSCGRKEAYLLCAHHQISWQNCQIEERANTCGRACFFRHVISNSCDGLCLRIATLTHFVRILPTKWSPVIHFVRIVAPKLSPV